MKGKVLRGKLTDVRDVRASVCLTAAALRKTIPQRVAPRITRAIILAINVCKEKFADVC